MGAPMKKITFLGGVLAFVGIATWFYLSVFSVRAQLSKQGIDYDEDSTVFASPTLTEFTCWYDHEGTRYDGPSITGTLLEVADPHATTEGTFRFTVRSKTFKTYSVQVELTKPPEGDRAFRVLDHDSSMLNVRYPQQGIAGAP